MTLNQFLENHTKITQSAYKNLCESYRLASITGKSEDYKKLEKAELIYNEIYTDKEKFSLLQHLAKENKDWTPIMQRQYDIVYRMFLWSQWDKKLLEEMIAANTKIEQKYSTYRAVYNNKEYTDNEIEEVLKEGVDSQELQWVREAHKAIGPHIVDDVLDLVRLRNKHAQSLWFKNFHTMSLFLGEQDESELDAFFDDLAQKTKDLFQKHKSVLDQHLATRYGCQIQDLKPWHYQNRYFQEVPQSMGSVDLDRYYKNQNIEELTKIFYEGIGLEIHDMLSNSDLYEKPGKNQHAYCIDCDKSWDIRVLCNIKPNEKRMGTMLHEFWHAVYDKYIDKNLPYVLRDPAHTFTTEAVAEYFQDLSSDGEWIQDMIGITDKEKQQIQQSSSYLIAFNKLIFAQWAQVIRRFEKALYADPEQNLNKLWRDLVAEYQLITPPEGRNSPDRATKIHIATAPCYYHNYLLGYVLAEQRGEKIKEISPDKPSLVDQKQVGKWFVENVFAVWSSLTWRELVHKSTGQDLNSDFFVQSIESKLDINK